MPYRNGVRQIIFPGDQPRWVSKEYILACMNDKELQDGWSPQPGDWYVCSRTDYVLQVESLDRFQEQSGEKADIFLPDPTRLEERVEQLRIEQGTLSRLEN